MSFFSIPHFMKIPVIAFSSVEGNQQTNEMTKTPVNPAVNPNNLLGLSDEMTFTERIKNSAVNLVELYYYQWVHHFNLSKTKKTLQNINFNFSIQTLNLIFPNSFIYLPQQTALFKKHFNEMVLGTLPNLIDLVHNVNLVLLNSHSLMQPARALPLNAIEVGGLQVKAKLDEVHPVSSCLLI
jgi:hypothetical protein